MAIQGYNKFGANQFKRLFEKMSASLVLLVVFFIISLLTLLGVADMVFEDKSLVFDNHIFALIHPYINDTNTSIFKAITFFGSAEFLVPANIILVLFFLVFKKSRHDAWKVSLVSVTSLVVLFTLKNILRRERPLMPLISKLHDYSFPSGHTFSSVVFYGMLLYIIHKNVQQHFLKWLMIIALLLLTLSIGCSRVYLRVHYPSDVIAGLCLGIIWLSLAKWLLIKKKNHTVPMVSV